MIDEVSFVQDVSIHNRELRVIRMEVALAGAVTFLLPMEKKYCSLR